MGRSKQAPYARAGVDADRAGSALKDLTALLRETFAFRKAIGRVMLPFGYFANVIALGKNLGLALSTDGVGTKILVAQMLGRFDTIGIDCVAMNVNDLLCVGAEPLALVDYVAVQSPNRRMFLEIGKGLHEGARRARITIPGGEIAQLREMIRGVHRDDGCDLVGTCVGIVPLDRIIIGQRIRPKDVVLGLRSSGIHSNGFSLVRKVFFDKAKMKVTKKLTKYGLDATLGEALLTPTKIYVKPILKVLQKHTSKNIIKGMAHITGGGLYDNIPRILPDGCAVQVQRGLWEIPRIFNIIQDVGDVEDKEMFHVFNMGIGMTLVVARHDAKAVLRDLEMAKEHGVIIGEVVKGNKFVHIM
ncbi:MAG: Phosphoribosylformylglycinamidine cyclo-ligase [Candidatus Brocadiaceae bacterium]|nr:Phosphoribosylformylglycinamidine cyclo-ligase [Candidatus Brocadiaceae bacterium]